MKDNNNLEDLPLFNDLKKIDKVVNIKIENMKKSEIAISNLIINYKKSITTELLYENLIKNLSKEEKEEIEQFRKIILLVKDLKENYEKQWRIKLKDSFKNLEPLKEKVKNFLEHIENLFLDIQDITLENYKEYNIEEIKDNINEILHRQNELSYEFFEEEKQKLIELVEKEKLEKLETQEQLEQLKEEKVRRAKPNEQIKSSLTPYYALITAKDYANALNVLLDNKSDKAFLAVLNKDFWQNIKLLKTGKISNQQETKYYSLDQLHIENRLVDVTLLQAIYSIWHDLEKDNDLSNGLTIHVADISKKTGINLKGKLINEFIDKIKEFDNVIGVINDNGFYRYFKLLSWQSYNEKTGMISFHSEFIKILREEMSKNNKIEMKNKYREQIEVIKPQHDFLIHSNITNERNKNAVELVIRVVRLLRQANSPDNTHIKFNNLIEFTNFEEVYKNTDNSNKPKVLKRAFSKFYQLLKEKTDLYEYYLDLDIPEIIPTPSTLSAVLNITYKEQNKSYVAKCNIG